MLDMTYFLPRKLHLAARQLGKGEYFDLNIGENYGHSWLIDYTKINFQGADPDEADQVRKLFDCLEGDACGQLCVLSKMMAQGPKLFTPSLDNCIAMENVDIHVPFDDYRQPYNPMIIQFPDAWRDRVRKKTGHHRVPELVVCYRHEQSGAVSLQSYFNRNDIVSALAVPRPQYRHIEDALNPPMPPVEDPVEEMEMWLSRFFQRMSMNFCLLLTHIGTRDLGWVDARQHERNEEMARQRRNRERGELFLAGDIARLGIAQTVRLYDVETRDRDKGDGSGITLPPHWRRGHWKRQAHGPQLSLRKRIFINPVFVCAHRFEGDLASTSVNYRDCFQGARVLERLPDAYKEKETG